MSHPIQSFDEAILATLQASFASLKEQGVLTPVVTLERLQSALSPEQRAIVEQIINLKPSDYGVNTPYAGELEPVPDDLVKLAGQRCIENDKEVYLADVYLPRLIFEAYSSMSEAFLLDHPSRKLLAGSCYRSPAYQVVVFINWLTLSYGGDVAGTIRHVSPPNYSQHTIASKAAIDFKTIDGSPTDEAPEKFKQTVEYEWLRRHGNSFGFHESWIEGNEFGMRAEPWHWQYLGISPTYEAPSMHIQTGSRNQAAEISALLTQLSTDHIAGGFGVEGQTNLLNSMTPAAIAGFFDQGFRYHVGVVDEQIVGVVATRDNCHLFHLFVQDGYQGRGYASALWAVAKQACLDSGKNPGYFTVNSSLNAQAVYKHWGFRPIGGIREGGGVKDLPMKMHLHS